MSVVKGEILESEEPYQGLNDDGTFTICTGQGQYEVLDREDFKILRKE